MNKVFDVAVNIATRSPCKVVPAATYANVFSELAIGVLILPIMHLCQACPADQRRRLTLGRVVLFYQRNGGRYCNSYR